MASLKNLSLVIALLVLASDCGWNPEKKLNRRTNSGGPALTDVDAVVSAQNANAANDTNSASGYDIQAELDKLRKEFREADEYLESRIDEEAEARKAADKELQDQVSELETKLTDLEIRLDGEIEDLQERDDLLEEIITSKVDALTEKFQEELEIVNSNAEELEKKFNDEKEKAKLEREQIATDLATLGTSLEAKLNSKSDEILAEIASVDERLKAADVALGQRLISAINTLKEQQDEALATEVASLEANIENSIAGVEAKLAAAKAELEQVDEDLVAAIEAGDSANAAALQVAKSELQTSINQLTEKTNTNSQAILANQQDIRLLNQQLESTKAVLEAQLDATRKTLAEAIAKGDETVAATLKEVELALTKRVDDLKKASEDEDTHIKSLLQESHKTLEDQLAATKTALTEAMAAKDLELANEISTLSQALTDGLNAAKIYTDGQIAGVVEQLETVQALLIAKLTSTQEELQAAINAGDTALAASLEEAADKLQDELELTEATLNAAISDNQEAINQNKINLDSLGQRLTEVKTELQAAITAGDSALAQQLQTAKSDLEKRIGDTETKLQQAITANKNAITASNNELKELLSTKLAEAEAQLQAAIDAGDAALAADLKREKEDLESEIFRVERQLSSSILGNMAEIRATRKNLEEKLKQTEKDLLASIELVKGELLSQLKEFNRQLKLSDEELRADLNLTKEELGDDLEAGLTAVRRELTQESNEIYDKIEDVIEQMSTQDKELAEQLLAELTNVENTLTASQNEMREILLAKIEANSNRIEERYAELQNFIAVNFATKEELEEAKDMARQLNEITVGIFNRKLDDQDKELRELVDQSILKLKNELSTKIDAVTAEVDSLRTDFVAHVETFETTVADLAAKSELAIAGVKKQIAQNAANDEATKKALEQEIFTLSKALLDLELFSQDMRKKFGAKILALEQKDSDLSQDIKNAKADAEAALTDAIAQEQRERAKLEQALSDLADEVARVARVAEQGLALAKDNEEAINGLQTRLEKAERDIDGVEDALEQLEKKVAEDIADIKKYAEGLVADLGSSTRDKLVKITTKLAELENKDNSLRKDLGRIANQLNSQLDPARFNEELHTELNDLSLAANELKAVLKILEDEFVNSIDPVHNTKVDTQPIFKDFVAYLSQVEACEPVLKKGYQERLEAPSIGHIEWYKILARGYILQLAAGIRSGVAAIDKILFDTKPLIDGTSLAGTLFIGLIPSFGEYAGGECLTEVKNWAKKALTRTDDPAFQKLRDALVRSKQLKIAATDLIPEVFKHLKTYTNKYESKLRKLIAAILAKPGADDSDSSLDPDIDSIIADLYAPITNIVRQRAELLVTITVQRKNMEQIAALARDLAEQKSRIDGNTASLTEFEEKFRKLTQRIDNFAKNYEKKTKQLTSGLTEAFSMIAGIAGRLGYDAIVDAANIQVSKLGGSLTKNYQWPVTCKATSRFYNFGEASPGATLKRCDSSITDADGTLVGDDGSSCRARQHFHTTTNINTNYHTHTTTTSHTKKSTTVTTTQNLHRHYTKNIRYAHLYRSPAWVRVARGWWGRRLMRTHPNRGNIHIGSRDASYWTSSSRWTAKVTRSTSVKRWVTTQVDRSRQISQTKKIDKSIDGAYIGDLTIPLLDANDPFARELLDRQEGDPIPEDLLTMIGLRVFGNAYFIKIEDVKNPERVAILNASDFEVNDTASSGILYEIPVSFFFAANPDRQISFSDEVKVTMLGPDGTTEMGESCYHKSNTAPPLYTFSTTTSTSSSSSASTNRVYQSSVSYRRRTTYSSSVSYRRVADYWQHAGHYHVYYVSPLVLDLKNKGKLETIAPRHTNLSFDIDADGKEEKIGWVGPEFGFLALDRNDNGSIDNGSELFGNNTPLGASDKVAEHGYAALAQYDTGKKGYVDTTDAVFRKLRVWVDQNKDGRSQPSELQPLASHGITKIAVTFAESPTNEKVQHAEQSSSNLVPYQSRYWGPESCGSEGCRTYDVYFGRDASIWLTDDN